MDMHTGFKRRNLLGLAAALYCGGALAAEPGYPSRPIRLIVPAPPGGPSDAVARAVGDVMAARLGQPFVTDNRAGATGMIGNSAVLSAPADGYTLMITTRTNQIIGPLARQQLDRFDPQSSLDPVGLIMRPRGVLATHASVPVETLEQFVRYVKTQPGGVFYGSAGVGASNHLEIERFKRLAGIDMVHVPYKGAGPLALALMSGEVKFALLDLTAARTGATSGALKQLAQDGDRRSSLLPDVPTIAEAGFPTFDPSFWVGMAARRGTPPQIIAALNQSLNEALSAQSVIDQARLNGWSLQKGAPELFAAQVAKDMRVYPPLVQELGLKLE